MKIEQHQRHDGEHSFIPRASFEPTIPQIQWLKALSVLSRATPNIRWEYSKLVATVDCTQKVILHHLWKSHRWPLTYMQAYTAALVIFIRSEMSFMSTEFQIWNPLGTMTTAYCRLEPEHNTHWPNGYKVSRESIKSLVRYSPLQWLFQVSCKPHTG
jgi:hypothetical protein